jgi:hypothetical protein
MSLKNKYKIIKKLTGLPVEGKLYTNNQSFDDKTIIIECNRIPNSTYVFLQNFDGVEYDIPIIDYNNMWEVEPITASESNKSNGIRYGWVIDSSLFPNFKPQNIGYKCEKTLKDFKEELTFPHKMLVSDDNEKFKIETVIAYRGDDYEFPWITDNDDNKKSCYCNCYKFAKPITDNDFIYLTPEDISDGKGVDVDPYLIKFKE